MDENQIFKWIANGEVQKIADELTAGIDPNKVYENGWTLLKLAVEHEQLMIVELLLNRGSDINQQPNGGWTALHQAVDIAIDGTIQGGGEPGDEPVDIILYLLDHGADIGAVDSQGESALDIAQAYKSEKVIAVLRKYL
ncbi:ankyrin repeat domain-containing protein [Paenibacillus bovis]|uniref:Uncharacterized protein n=1 Tax=Paenibacillus bovis TaxID=1616788 RepID=A0A172ZL52_9BACL|nr:ankyrin repeat domain-containing protein [Paenibacillus bovis]ANF97870.1 hypothetical protein AR543_18850 [Paenibacillus bovis]